MLASGGPKPDALGIKVLGRNAPDLIDKFSESPVVSSNWPEAELSKGFRITERRADRFSGVLLCVPWHEHMFVAGEDGTARYEARKCHNFAKSCTGRLGVGPIGGVQPFGG